MKDPPVILNHAIRIQYSNSANTINTIKRMLRKRIPRENILSKRSCSSLSRKILQIPHSPPPMPSKNQANWNPVGLGLPRLAPITIPAKVRQRLRTNDIRLPLLLNLYYATSLETMSTRVFAFVLPFRSAEPFSNERFELVCFLSNASRPFSRVFSNPPLRS